MAPQDAGMRLHTAGVRLHRGALRLRFCGVRWPATWGARLAELPHVTPLRFA